MKINSATVISLEEDEVLIVKMPEDASVVAHDQVGKFFRKNFGEVAAQRIGIVSGEIEFIKIKVKDAVEEILLDTKGN